MARSKATVQEDAQAFSKEELLNAKVFENRKDLLNVLLNDEEGISIEEAQERIDAYLKGKVE